MNTALRYSPGLEGVVVGETAISNVEGDIGRLSYRGITIQDIVQMDYLSVVHLLLFGDLPNKEERVQLQEYLLRFGNLSANELAFIRSLPVGLHPMQALQAIIPALDHHNMKFRGCDAEASHGLQIIARYPSILAALHAGDSTDERLARFSESSDYLEQFLLMFTGEKPKENALDVFRTVQLLQLDHSFNAGTFATRVIGSTLASVEAVMAGGAGALSGVLHGGADQAALLSAREVGAPENATAYIDDLLARKGRLMGMGHREYRILDPRAAILKPLARSLCEGTALEQDFQVLEALEVTFNQRMNKKGKDVWANLEFYKGVVYEALGIPDQFFTATFAMARSVGWLAHFIESRPGNKIIRPAAHYVGHTVVS